MNVTLLLQRSGDADAAVCIAPDGARSVVRQRELWERIARLRGGLQELGVRAGHSVVIIGGAPLQTLESVIAAIGLGATAVPLSPLLPPLSIATILTRLRPACSMATTSVTGAIADCLAEVDTRLVALDGEPQPTARVACSYESLLGGSSAAAQPVAPHHPALMMHTSGSEGRPKSVVLTHHELRTFLNHHEFLQSQFVESGGREPCSAIVTVLPLSHLGGLAVCLYGLACARPLYLVEQFVADHLLEVMAEAQCSSIMLIPGMYKRLLDRLDGGRAGLTSLEYCITLGEPCGSELTRRIEAAFGTTVASAYGLTECLTGIGHSRTNLMSGNVKPGSCGTLCFGEAKLLDDHGREHAELGELWVRNPTVRACYAEANLNELRLHDGWFNTKDVFYRDAEGFYFHRGRTDDMFICNGKNIYPAELENLLMQHPRVAEVCVTPVMKPDGGAMVGALFVAKDPLTESEAIGYCVRNAAPHTIPGVVIVADSMPRLPSGKVDRVRATTLLQARWDQAHAPVADSAR